MNNLKKLRELCGLKQGALARECNVRNQASISEWETGRKGLSLENAIMFSEYFGVSVGCVAGTEAIPEGFPHGYVYSTTVQKILEDQKKAAEEKRLMNPERKNPFNKAQTEYLEQMEDRIAQKVASALKEDSLLLKEEGKAE